MNKDFDIGSIENVEFGVCRDVDDGESFLLVPVDNDVKQILKEMLAETKSKVHSDGEPQNYQPAEKYSSIEQLKLPLANDMVTRIKEVYDAENLPTDAGAIADPDGMIAYFALFYDKHGNKVFAMRRSTQFKGILKARNRLIRWEDETLKIIPDNVFKLDQDFDFYVSNDMIYIYRPSGFEYTAALDEHILQQAEQNSRALEQDIGFVNFDGIVQYVANHKRAARLVASLRSRDDLSQISKTHLKKLCKEYLFLQVLDRRRYNVTLIENNDETYVAASRRRAK